MTIKVDYDKRTITIDGDYTWHEVSDAVMEQDSAEDERGMAELEAAGKTPFEQRVDAINSAKGPRGSMGPWVCEEFDAAIGEHPGWKENVSRGVMRERWPSQESPDPLPRHQAEWVRLDVPGKTARRREAVDGKAVKEMGMIEVDMRKRTIRIQGYPDVTWVDLDNAVTVADNDLGNSTTEPFSLAGEIKEALWRSVREDLGKMPLQDSKMTFEEAAEKAVEQFWRAVSEGWV